MALLRDLIVVTIGTIVEKAEVIAAEDGQMVAEWDAPMAAPKIDLVVLVGQVLQVDQVGLGILAVTEEPEILVETVGREAGLTTIDQLLIGPTIGRPLANDPPVLLVGVVATGVDAIAPQTDSALMSPAMVDLSVRTVLRLPTVEVLSLDRQIRGIVIVSKLVAPKVGVSV